MFRISKLCIVAATFLCIFGAEKSSASVLFDLFIPGGEPPAPLSDVNLVATATDEGGGVYQVTDLSGNISLAWGDLPISLIPGGSIVSEGNSLFGYNNLSFVAGDVTFTLSTLQLTNILSYFNQPQETWDVQPNTVQFAAAAPEPSTWLMMIFGFCGLGFMTYRRKDKLALSAI
jgi:hypothetical protein